MNKHVKMIAAVLALTLALGNTVVMADPLSDQLQQNQNMLKNAKGNTDQLEAKMEDLDTQIENLMSQMDSNKKKITQTQNDITSADNELKQAQDDLQKEQLVFGQRMRYMYINGVNGYLSILLEANGLGDFLSRIEIVRKIVALDNQVVSDLKSKQDKVNQRKIALTTEQNSLLALEKDNTNKLNILNQNKSDQAKLVNEAKQKENLYAANVASTLKQIQAIRDSVPKYVPSRGAVPISDNAVIAFASNFLGTPYVWGGTSPVPGFDCSGFVQYVYRHFGISLARTTYDQINEGVPVSSNQLQPGDLVFFGTWSNPHHVGMYVGNGMYIHAPHTGDVVRVSPLSGSDYFTARRVR